MSLHQLQTQHLISGQLTLVPPCDKAVHRVVKTQNFVLRIESLRALF